jgi:hypothetical protein
MLKTFYSGWMALNRIKSVIALIFVWHVLWGALFYTLSKEIIAWIMFRLPNASFTPLMNSLFSFEAEFLIMNTSVVISSLSVIFTLLAIRYLFSPIIQAGLYYTLKELGDRPLHLFFQGIRKWCVTFYITNGIKWLLMILPLVWLSGLWFMIRNGVTILILFLLLGLSIFLLTGFFEGIAYFLTGWFLLGIQQLSLLVRTIGKVLFLATWTELYRSKKPLVL